MEMVVFRTADFVEEKKSKRFLLVWSINVIVYRLLWMDGGRMGPQTSMWRCDPRGADRDRRENRAWGCLPEAQPEQVIEGGGRSSARGRSGASL